MNVHKPMASFKCRARLFRFCLDPKKLRLYDSRDQQSISSKSWESLVWERVFHDSEELGIFTKVPAQVRENQLGFGGFFNIQLEGSELTNRKSLNCKNTRFALKYKALLLHVDVNTQDVLFVT